MRQLPKQTGSALLLAIFFMGILAATGAVTFGILQKRYRQVHQTATWQEALLSAEAGIDIAVNEMRKEIYDPTKAWAGWKDQADATPTVVGGTAPVNDPSASPIYFTSQVLLRAGEGGQRSFSKIQVDAPSFLIDPTGEQWFRVRSTGVAELPGGAVVAGDKEDLRLRKFDLRYDRRDESKPLARPQAARVIEAIVKPVGALRLALLGVNGINLNNHNIVVDSYDSRDPNKSTNGFYDPAKRQEHGSIATNGTLIDAGSAHIYGDAATNGGTVLSSSNVTGEIRDDFYQELFSVIPPDITAEAGSPGSVSGTTVLDAKAGAPANYILSTINLSGPNTLRIKGATDAGGNPVPTYAQIIVHGDISTSGQAEIILDPGVYVRVFVAGDMAITGQGITNPNSPLNLQLYGLDRPKNAAGQPISPGNLKIAGNGGFRGTVYAPSYNVKMVGGGTEDSIYGAFVGWNVAMTGVQTVHYDEALADGGLIADYKVVSWFEDVR